MSDEYEFIIEILKSLEERLEDLNNYSKYEFRTAEKIETEKEWLRKRIEEYTIKKEQMEKHNKTKRMI